MLWREKRHQDAWAGKEKIVRKSAVVILLASIALSLFLIAPFLQYQAATRDADSAREKMGIIKKSGDDKDKTITELIQSNDDRQRTINSLQSHIAENANSHDSGISGINNNNGNVAVGSPNATQTIINQGPKPYIYKRSLKSINVPLGGFYQTKFTVTVANPVSDMKIEYTNTPEIISVIDEGQLFSGQMTGGAAGSLPIVEHSIAFLTSSPARESDFIFSVSAIHDVISPSSTPDKSASRP